MKIGDSLYDMHGQNFASPKLNEQFELGQRMEWLNEASTNFYLYLQNVQRTQNEHAQYLNKMLVVVGERLGEYETDDWFIAAYSYDGRRYGICEIRERT